MIIKDGHIITERFHCNMSLYSKYNGDKLVWNKKYSYRLPVEYQEVEYIESTGSQYIKLNLIPSENHSFTTRVKITDKSVANNMIIGSRSNGTFQTSEDQIYMNWQKVDKKVVLRNRYSINDNHYTEESDGFFDLRNVKNENCMINNAVQPYYLFALNKLGEADALANCRMCYFIIYGNGIIANLVPCYRKHDRKSGMYDTVTNTFYSSQTNSDFLVGDDIKCSKLDYIENPNSNFIDLNLKMKSSYSTTISYQYNKYTVGFLFGSRSNNKDRSKPSNDANIAYSILLGTTKENFDVCNTFVSSARFQNDYNSKKRTVLINNKGVWINNEKMKTFNNEVFTTVNNAFIFSCPYCLIGDTKTVGFVDAKIYSLEIKDNDGNVLLNLIPYKIGSTIGLLDTISKVHFTGELINKPFTNE